MNARARCWSLTMLLAACEVSVEGSGAPADNPSDRPSAPMTHESDNATPREREDSGASERDAGRVEPGMDEAGSTLDSGAPATNDDDAGADDNDDDDDDDDDAAVDTREPRTASTGELLFVSAGGADNMPWVYTSCDGHSWTRRMLALPPGHPTAGEGAGLRGVAYGAGTFVITGGGGSNGSNVRLLGRSQDGVNWQWEQNAPACSDCQWTGGAAFLDDGKDGVWIAGGGTGTRLYSRDGARSWQKSAEQGRAAYRRFRSDGKRAVGAGAGVLTVIELAPPGAREPVVWHDESGGSPHESVYLAAGNGVFVAVWYDDGCRFLREGTSWQTCELPDGRDPVLTSVVFGNGKFSILGRGAPLESEDGEHWTIAPSGSGTDFRDVVYADGTYATRALYSRDARSWQAAAPAAENAVALAAGRLGAGRACPR